MKVFSQKLTVCFIKTDQISDCQFLTDEISIHSHGLYCSARAICKLLLRIHQSRFNELKKLIADHLLDVSF